MAELERLWIVRHGESVGNVAAADAEAAGVDVIELRERDADVPLSPTGREQARATGRWLSRLPAAERPRVVVASPYLRTRQTAELLLGDSGVPLTLDERLRDRELGVLDLHTSHGVRTRLPEEAARRTRLGKFYYRPPGGESWTDVALRLRGLLADLRRDHDGERVLLVGHEAVVVLLRYLVEGLDESGLMTLARDNPVANCSVTGWRRDRSGRLTLVTFADVDHLRHEGTPPTREDEVRAEPV